MVDILRGDIFWVNLDPTLGTEIKKKRPALVVSNNAANRRYQQITILPLTSQRTDKVEPFQVFLEANESGLSKASKALAEQIRTISKQRLGKRAGHVPPDLMKKINLAIQIHLDLDRP